MLHSVGHGTRLSRKRELQIHNVGQFRATEGSWVETRVIADTGFEREKWNESNRVLENFVTAKDVWDIFTCGCSWSDHLYSEYRLQQVTCSSGSAKGGD
jgi:hypothetical protein